jgi:RNA polymerase sigma-70 factor (ECF subfamily)
LYDGDDHLFDDPDFYVFEELSQKIQSALEALPSNYREAFEMNRFQKLTYKEIASQLNVSSKTVDYRIQQALKQLRIDLKDYLPLILFLS